MYEVNVGTVAAKIGEGSDAHGVLAYGGRVARRVVLVSAHGYHQAHMRRLCAVPLLALLKLLLWVASLLVLTQLV